MLKLYTDDSPGLRMYVVAFLTRQDVWLTVLLSDPYVVLILSLAFIGSIFFLHISAKLLRVFTK